jgi:hypothetical protein
MPRGAVCHAELYAKGSVTGVWLALPREVCVALVPRGQLAPSVAGMVVSAPQHLFAALLRPRFLVSSWPWRSLGYVLTNSALALGLLPVTLTLGLPWLLLLIWWLEGRPGPLVLVLPVLVFGLLLIAVLGPLVAVPVAALERWRLRLVDTRPSLGCGPGCGPVTPSAPPGTRSGTPSC